MGGALGFLGLDDRYEQLSKSGDPLAHLPAAEGFEALRYRLEMAWERSDGSMDGGPLCDPNSRIQGPSHSGTA